MFVPASDPFADAAELGAPPARTELSEYIEETDMRFVDISPSDGRGLSAGSGSWGYLSSPMTMPGESFGVVKSSSTAMSSPPLLIVLPRSKLCFHPSVPVDVV